MKSNLLKTLFLGLLLFVSICAVNAQSQVKVEQKERSILVVGAKNTIGIAGKVGFVVVKETAKIAWKTTKFTAGEIAAPVAKGILLKAAPKVSLFLLKQSGNVVEKAAPIALKAALTYLKL